MWVCKRLRHIVDVNKEELLQIPNKNIDYSDVDKTLFLFWRKSKQSVNVWTGETSYTITWLVAMEERVCAYGYRCTYSRYYLHWYSNYLDGLLQSD